jgi:uncharacterized protein YmfQ (DUF2313 family)
MFGGYSPYPRRFGGGKPRLQIIHESLNAQRGTTFNPQPDTVVWMENMAFARALCFDGWGTNERLGNQWDPDRMTDMLPRWEKILKIPLYPSFTKAERRAAVKDRFARFGAVPYHSWLTTRLSDALGDYFVAVEYIDLANAVVHSPDGSYPWGTVAAGAPWSSTVAHVLVRTDKPAGASETLFYEAVGKVAPLLDSVLPSWNTFDWYRGGPTGAPVSGGPSLAGFFLDETNLDNEVFDS